MADPLDNYDVTLQHCTYYRQTRARPRGSHCVVCRFQWKCSSVLQTFCECPVKSALFRHGVEILWRLMPEMKIEPDEELTSIVRNQ